MQNFVASVFAVNSVLALLVGASVYLLGKKKLKNAIWFVYNILFSTWSFCIYNALQSQSQQAALYWYRSSVGALIFLVPVFLHFLSIYSDREIFKRQILGKIYILFFLFFALSFLIPKEFIANIARGIFFKYMITPGIAFGIFVFLFMGFLFCGFYYLLRSSKVYETFKYNQRMWLFWGMLLGAFAPLSFLLAAYKINVFPFGIFCVIPYLVLVSYLVIKHYVFEIDILVNKMVVLAYFTVFVLFMHIFIVHVLHRIAGVEYFTCSIISGGIVLLNLLFIAHYSGVLKLDKLSERIVYEKKLKYYKFLESFSPIAEKITNPDALANYILDSLVDAVGVERAVLYLYNEESSEFELAAERGMDRSALSEVSGLFSTKGFVNVLKEDSLYVANENKDFAEQHNLEKIKESFEKIKLKLSIPLYCGREMVGFLNLGDKNDKTPYSKEDIDILNAFGRQLSICLDNAKLYSRAVKDDLTGLYRINYLNRRIQEEIDRFDRYSRPFSFVLIDVDDFKKVNDTYGHQAGDVVLKRIARSVKTHIRKADIAARYGGEEFCVLMPETNKDQAIAGAERIRRVIEKKSEELHGRFCVTVSMGVADYKPGMKKYGIIKEADEALYKAKREGKNRVC